MQIERIGDTWYSADAEYTVRHTHSGYSVVRGDGSYAEFLGSDEAEEAAQRLAAGDASDDEYEWTDSH